MYWRVRKLTVDQLVRKYIVHALLIVSALANVVLIVLRPSLPKMSADTKVGFEQFVRTVTEQLLDTSYISYKNSTVALLQGGSLAPSVINGLRQQEMLAEDDG